MPKTKLNVSQSIMVKTHRDHWNDSLLNNVFVDPDHRTYRSGIRWWVVRERQRGNVSVRISRHKTEEKAVKMAQRLINRLLRKEAEKRARYQLAA